MRLLQVIADSTEAFFERLTMALQRDGITQRLIMRRDRARAHLLSRRGLPVTQLPFGGRADLYTRWRIGREIEAWSPDIVLAWRARAAVKTPRSRAVLCGWLGGYDALKDVRHCDHLIGATEDIAAHVCRQGWPAERAHYLPIFAGAKRVAPLDRKAFDTPADAPLVVAHGPLRKNSAFDVLIDAMADVPDTFLWLSGTGPEEDALRRRVVARGLDARVRFLGRREDSEAVLAAGDLCVCPAREDPLGEPVLAAFAQGLPVIAAASQGATALIEYGVNGLLAPVDDAVALADAINQVVADAALRYALAREGFATYQRQFTEAAVVAHYRAFFEKVRR